MYLLLPVVPALRGAAPAKAARAADAATALRIGDNALPGSLAVATADDHAASDCLLRPGKASKAVGEADTAGWAVAIAAAITLLRLFGPRRRAR